MNKDKTRAVRRKLRVRKKLNNIKKHKLLVFRSSKHIYALYYLRAMIKHYVHFLQLN